MHLISKNIFIFLSFIFISISSFVKAESTYGVFMVVKGDIQVTSTVTSTQNKTPQPAKVGFKVFEGDSIQSGADSRGKIVMSDRNVLNINPDTKLIIKKYTNDSSTQSKAVEINLIQGKLRTQVEQKYDGEKNKFEIKTPTAVAGVRGTRFLVGYDPSSRLSQVFTFQGAVTFSSYSITTGVGPSVEVKKGQSTSVENGKPPEPPKEIPREQMKQIDREAQTESSKSPEKNPAPRASPANSQAPAADSMMDARDLNLSNMNGQIKNDMGGNINMPPPPPPNFDPRNAPLVPPPPPDIIRDIISNTNSKTKVIITPVPK